MAKLLIVVDMQNDFITGPLGTPEARGIVDNIRNKIDEAIINDEPILFTQDTHYSNYLTTNEGKHLPIPHCMRNTEGWEIIPELRTPDKTSIDYLIKFTFGSLSLADTIFELIFEYGETHEDYIDTIELCGVCTDICVVSNALILKSDIPEDFEFVVDSKACAGTTPEAHEAALKVMESCQIKII